MQLQSPTTYFSLTIVGYQFPDLLPEHNNAYDPNWLMTRISAATSEGTWTANDPSLLTSEVADLIDWLSALTVFSGAKSIRFTEPNISFTLAHLPYNQPTLEIHLAAENRPPWHRNTPTDTILAFPLPNINLPTQIASLKQQLAQFPPRPPK